MRSSRGLGAISSSKMPNKKTIKRTDNPDEVSMYKKGGKVKGYNGIDGSMIGEDVDGGSAGRGNNGLPILPPKPKPPKKKPLPKKFNTVPDLMENDDSTGLKKGGRVKRK